MGTQLKCPNCGGYKVSINYAARKGWLYSYIDFLTVGLLTILNRFIGDAHGNQTSYLMECEICGHKWSLK